MQENCIDYYEEYLELDCCGCCLLCVYSEDGCLCYDCKCRQCYWYHPIDCYEGYCEKISDLKRNKREHAHSSSNKKIRNVSKTTDKAILAQIDFSDLMWIPKSAINIDGYVKNWFIEKYKL